MQESRPSRVRKHVLLLCASALGALLTPAFAMDFLDQLRTETKPKIEQQLRSLQTQKTNEKLSLRDVTNEKREKDLRLNPEPDPSVYTLGEGLRDKTHRPAERIEIMARPPSLENYKSVFNQTGSNSVLQTHPELKEWMKYDDADIVALEMRRAELNLTRMASAVSLTSLDHGGGLNVLEQNSRSNEHVKEEVAQSKLAQKRPRAFRAKVQPETQNSSEGYAILSVRKQGRMTEVAMQGIQNKDDLIATASAPQRSEQTSNINKKHDLDAELESSVIPAEMFPELRQWMTPPEIEKEQTRRNWLAKVLDPVPQVAIKRRHSKPEEQKQISTREENKFPHRHPDPLKYQEKLTQSQTKAEMSLQDNTTSRRIEGLVNNQSKDLRSSETVITAKRQIQTPQTKKLEIPAFALTKQMLPELQIPSVPEVDKQDAIQAAVTHKVPDMLPKLTRLFDAPEVLTVEERVLAMAPEIKKTETQALISRVESEAELIKAEQTAEQVIAELNYLKDVLSQSLTNKEVRFQKKFNSRLDELGAKKETGVASDDLRLAGQKASTVLAKNIFDQAKQADISKVREGDLAALIESQRLEGGQHAQSFRSDTPEIKQDPALKKALSRYKYGLAKSYANYRRDNVDDNILTTSIRGTPTIRTTNDGTEPADRMDQDGKDVIMPPDKPAQLIAQDEAKTEMAALEQLEKEKRIENNYVEISAALGEKDLPDMNMAQVVAHTIETSPIIGINSAQTEEAEKSIDIARAEILPKVLAVAQYGYENTYNSRGELLGVNRSEYDLKINQKLFDFNKSKLNIERAKQTHMAASLREKDKREEVLLEVVNAYIDIVEKNEFIYHSRKNLERHNEIYELVKQSEEGGNATLADVQRALTRLENAQKLLIEFESQKERAATNFKRLTRLEPGKLAPPRIELASLKPLSTERVTEIIEKNPQVQSIKKEAEGFHLQKDIHDLEGMPEFLFESLAKGKKNINSRTEFQQEMKGMVVMKWNLYDGGERSARKGIANARLMEQNHRYKKRVYELEQALKDANRLIVTSFEKQNILNARVKSANEVYDLYTKQFKAGERSIFEVLDALQDVFVTKLDLIQNKYAMQRAKYIIMRYEGALVEGIL